MINSFFRQRAFSLIELLVVVLVIVMLTTVVSLNVGTGGRGIKRATRSASWPQPWATPSQKRSCQERIMGCC